MTFQIELHPFPNIAVMTLLYQHRSVCFEGQEHFQKGGYRNRYHIAGPNGLHRLSIPLSKGKHQGLPIQEVQISYTENWPLKHWRSIEAAYGKSPFFIHYADELKALIYSEFNSIFEWNMASLEWSLTQIQLEIDINVSSAYEASEGPLNYRNQISPKAPPSWLPLKEYPQVFSEKNGFIPNLSILDLLFCQGPMSIQYLDKLTSFL